MINVTNSDVVVVGAITAAGAGSASAIAINGWLLQYDFNAATAARSPARL
ncbi:hypothetical protein [Microbacterium allomyrinae]|uniref:Uncharacterized protein n=1 Tax=Microbacterium allomyrinae TaxID=2830666 RepID=A0A9X1LWY3_9MICO|nr:hypothetical protein [Microbacterium allomyrinae]MCC2033158.1 hypothetical protein [Microbacterium allomyrinae]